ncbi:hypothetical protein MTO96_051415 [Rhipicephalus appendiculatus]
MLQSERHIRAVPLQDQERLSPKTYKRPNCIGTCILGFCTCPEPPPTPRPERKPRTDDGNILLCTISHRAFHKGLYPHDGLCDLLFYTMAYYEPTSKEILGSYDVFSFDVFRTKVKDTPADSRTQYGVSFEYRYGKFIADQLKSPDAQNSLKDLWNDRIYHYGILELWADPSDIQSTDKLQLFTELKKRQDVFGADKEGHRVLGFQHVDVEYTNKTADSANYLINKFPITILVTMTHTFKTLDEQFSEGPSFVG